MTCHPHTRQPLHPYLPPTSNQTNKHEVYKHGQKNPHKISTMVDLSFTGLKATYQTLPYRGAPPQQNVTGVDTKGTQVSARADDKKESESCSIIVNIVADVVRGFHTFLS